MKVLFFLLSFMLSHSNSNASENLLKIHVIIPKFRIDWSSPRSLALTSGILSLGNDYAPIGHFATEVHCSSGTHLLTGMERENKAESRRITLSKGLGLGSLIYPFKGALVSSSKSQQEIYQAKQEGRLKTLEVFTSGERCDRMVEFIDRWIQKGSYQVYGGGMDTVSGQGAGYADFAMTLFAIASGTPSPSSWSARVNLPKSLLGDGKDKKVPFQKLLVRSYWAHENEASLSFSSADTNLITDWIERRVGQGSTSYLYISHLFPGGVLYSSGGNLREIAERAALNLPDHGPLRDFRFQYQTTLKPKEVWRKITTF